MTKTACKFDIEYLEPKSKEEKRTLSEQGYIRLPVGKALALAESMKQLTKGDKKIEILPQYIKDGSVEFRYYIEGAKGIEGERGNRFFAYFKETDTVLPIALRDEEEVKILPSISEIEERRKSTK